MSKIYVSEFADVAQMSQGDSVEMFASPALSSYTVIVSAAVSGGPVFKPTTKFVEISADTTCSFRIDFASGGGCALTDTRLNANERIQRRVPTNAQGAGSGYYPVLSTAYAIFTTANV